LLNAINIARSMAGGAWVSPAPPARASGSVSFDVVGFKQSGKLFAINRRGAPMIAFTKTLALYLQGLSASIFAQPGSGSELGMAPYSA
jgi:hypothetical protein